MAQTWFAERLLGVLVASVLAALVLLTGLKLATRSAGGADTYGYVSQAYLWLEGDLRVEQPLAATVPWPNADWTLSPLGYRPGPVPHTLVPVYSPGLPLIMAAAIRAFGSCAPYVIMPIAAAALVLLTYLLGRRVAGGVCGSIAALLMATSPTMLFQMMLPMSDVIVTTLWTAAVLLAFGESLMSTISAGLVCGLAILVRPNLVLQSAIPLLIVLLQSRSRIAAVRKALVLIAAIAPGILLVAIINNYLYGSPSASGYGTVSSIYSLRYFGANLSRYPSWLLESQGPLVFVFLTAVLRLRRTAANELPWRALFLLFVVLLVLPYLVYLPFDAWWFLRFLLPAFPLMFVLAADSLIYLTRRLPLPWRTIAVALGSALMAFHGFRFSMEQDLTGTRSGEQRYAAVGRFIADELPAKSVCLAMQHSGTIRHYSHCVTLRYDILDRNWLDRAIAHFAKEGYHAYLIIDGWEAEAFRQRFKDRSELASLSWVPLAGMETADVRIYDLLERHTAVIRRPLMQIPSLPRNVCLGPGSHAK
jgi:hypothetical protein